MADSDAQPRNRKERRAAARAAGTPLSSAKAPNPQPAPKRTEADLGIPMAVPDFSGPKGKTLYELADERMRALRGEDSNTTSSNMIGEEVVWNADKGAYEANNPDDEDFGPAAEALLYGFSLTMLHLTLDVLVHNQYREEIAWGEIAARTAQVAPLLWFTLYLFKTETAMRFPTARQCVFWVAAVAAGCYCVQSGNTYGYYAVMKRAPPVGTLWIWTVVEMRLLFAVTSVVAVAGYTWWNGFGLY